MLTSTNSNENPSPINSEQSETGEFYTAQDLARDSRCSLKLAKRVIRLIGRQFDNQDQRDFQEYRLRLDSAKISPPE